MAAEKTTEFPSMISIEKFVRLRMREFCFNLRTRNEQEVITSNDALPFHVQAARDMAARQQEKTWADHEQGRIDSGKLKSRTRNLDPGQNRER